MGEFEELRKVGTKLSRAAEIELQKKQQQIQYEEAQRKKQEEANRRRKEAETQKLLRQELERKRFEEEQRKRDAAAQLRAKERAREREREQERERQLQEKAKKQRANASGPTYSRSKATYSGTSSSGSASRSMDALKAAPPKRQEYSFEALQKMAQPNGGSSTKSQNGTHDRSRNGERDERRTLPEGGSRQAAIERLKVTRGISPERTLSSSQSYNGTKILKKPPVKRSSAPKSVFPNFRIPTKNVNHVRDAGLKALRDGPIALNTEKRDRRSVEEVTAELREKDARRDERARKMKAIEEEREKQRLHREKAFQAAKYQRALMSDDAHETERLHKEITGESKTSRKARSVSRSRSRSRSPRRRSRSRSPVRRKRSKSPPRKRRSASPVPTKKRRYSPEARKRSLSPKRRRSVSPPPKRKMSRDLSDRERDRDRDWDRERDRERERAREREGDRDTRQSKGKIANGSTKRRVSRSPSPRPKKRAGSPRSSGRSRGPFEEDLSVSSVIAGLFGTRYRARVEDEDLSDDMEARPDEVFREEARRQPSNAIQSMDEHEAQEHQDSPSSLLPEESSSTKAQQLDNVASVSDESMEHTTEDATSTSTADALALQDAPDTMSKAADAQSPDGAAPDNIDVDTVAALESETNDEAQPPKPADATDNDDFGDFGDFGSAEPRSLASAAAPGDKADDDFDDFSAPDPTLKSNDHGEEEGEDDDDGFGDFGEVQAAGADDDDEFGDFNDFAAAGGDDFQDSGDFGDFTEGNTADGDDPFGAQEPVAAVESPTPAPQPPVEQPVEVEIAPDFSAVNSRQVENYVLDRLSELYPLDGSLANSSSGDETLVGSPQLLNPDLDSMDTASILSDQALWTSLCETSFLGGHTTADDNHPDSASSAPQFQWKHSVLRKEYYASLGLVIAKEQASVAHTSIPNSSLSPASSRSKVSSPMVVATETMAERKPLDLEATRAYCQFTKENLGGYSGDEMKDIIARLTELTQHASEELTHWLDQREQMIMDSERYNEMIASLVGRAAKLKDAESKQNTKTKRITRTSFHLK